MLHNNSIWQSNSDNWQSLFMRENFLCLGHSAWQGFLNQGQGMVVCHLVVEDMKSVDWRFDLVEYETHYLNALEAALHLRLLDLKEKEVALLMDKVHNYNPETEMLLLIKENSNICLTLLRNMAIDPPDCYQQLKQRQSEFQLTISPQGGIYQ